MKDYSSYHLATLYDMVHKGPQPCRKADIARLVKDGLVIAGKRGAYGQTFYSLTKDGKAFAARISLYDRKYSVK